MADIRAFAGWRYNSELIQQIDQLTSPLFDVVSDKQRAALYTREFNSIHLSVPSENNPAAAAKQRLDSWKERGVLVQDKLPAIYVYYQYFSLPGSSKEYCRKGFICNIRVHDYDEKVIHRH